MKHQTILITILALTLLLAACSGVITETAPEAENTTDNSILQTEPNNSDPANGISEEPAVEPAEDTTPDQAPAADPEGSMYWVEVQDPNHGFRFAVPCFWRVDFPAVIPGSTMDPAGSSYSAFNYPDGYASQFPRGVVPPENGAIKVDFSPIDLVFAQDIPDDISLEDYVAYKVSMWSGVKRELVSVEEASINGNKALFVTIINHTFESSESYYILRLNAQYLLKVTEIDMSNRYGSEDVQGIINSITLDPQAAVLLPDHIPGEPPVGVDASCMQ
jgi:hypothetical protein